MTMLMIATIMTVMKTETNKIFINPYYPKISEQFINAIRQWA